MESDLVAVGVGEGECPAEGRVDLETSLGYLLKEASSALRVAMDEVLRPLGQSGAFRILQSMIRSLRDGDDGV